MLSAERKAFCEKTAAEGIFFRKRIASWGGRVSYSYEKNPALEKVEGELMKGSAKASCVRKISCKDLTWTRQVATKLDRFLLDWTYATPYGIFVPGPNADYVLGEMKKLEADFWSGRDKVMQGYDSIVRGARRDFKLFANHVWQNERGFEGEPTKAFVDAYVEERVAALVSRKDKVRDGFHWEMLFSQPVLGPEDTSYAAHIDMEEHNMRVYRALFDAILRKRRAMYYMLRGRMQKITDGKSSRAFANLRLSLSAYLCSVFYPAEELVAKSNQLIELLAFDEEGGRTKEAVAGLVNEIMELLRRDPLFLIEVVE